jgi:hypothetical protein
MVTKQAQEPKTEKQAAKAHWQCMACYSDFWGSKKAPKCPKCGAEGFDLKELNAEGIPLQDVKNALSGGVDVTQDGGNTIIQGKTPQTPQINLDYSRAAIGRADDIAAEMFERDMTSAIQSDVSNKVKAKAAESKATLLEQEQKLKGMEHAEGDDMAPQNPFSMNSVSASSLIQSISGLPEEEREWWLGQIKDPQTVYGLATLLNPPKQTMQGNIPFPQQQNQLMNLMGMRQQMDQMQPQQQPQQGGEETSSMLELAQAFKILQETAVASIPKPVDNSESNSELKEALRELKDSQEKLNDRYYALKVEQLEGGGGGGITEERLEAILATKLASATKSPLQSLQELKATMTEIDGLRGMLEPKTDIVHGEPIDEWMKKHTMTREMQDDKLRSEERIASQNAKAAKWGVAKNLLSDGIKANLAARTRDTDDESAKEEVPDVLRRKKVTLVK